LVLIACTGTSAPTSQPSAAGPTAASEAPSQPTKKPLIGFSNLLRTGCQFCTDVETGVTTEVAKAGWDLFAVDNNLDANQIVANADAMIARKVDVYLNFEGIGNYSVTQPKLREAGIPVIYIDGPFPDFAFKGAYWLGANNGEAGKILGEYAVKYAKDNWDGKIDAIFATFQSSWPDETKKRLVEAMNVISAFDPQFTMSTITISDAVLAGEKTQAEATAFLNAHPGKNHLLFIATTNDVAGLAEESALSAAGRAGDGVILSMGADSSAQEAIRAGGDFKMSVAFGPENYGKQLIPLVAAILNGEEPPSITRAIAAAVDATNIDTLYPQ
jgi:ABC-type sugar transport system substrate-binding protein